MVEPVRKINKIIGYKTFASCEGHKNTKNPHQKPRSPSHSITIDGEPYSSYVGFYLPLLQHCPLVDFLLNRASKRWFSGIKSEGKYSSRIAMRILST